MPGEHNDGPIADPGPRCPIAEWREVSAADGETVAPMATLSANEHWLVMQGGLEVELEGRVEPTRLAEQDGPRQSKQSIHHALACLRLYSF